MPKRPERKTPGWLHALPLVLLLAGVAALPVRDSVATAPAFVSQDGKWVEGPSAESLPLDPTPYLVVLFDYSPDYNAARKKPLEPDEPDYFQNNFNFGMRALVPSGAGDVYRYEQILFGPRGNTNNTLIKVDDREATFGKSLVGSWVRSPTFGNWIGTNQRMPSYFQRSGVGTWSFDNINITQTVRVVPGEAVPAEGGKLKRLQNVCEVFYKLENTSKKSHKVGMRVLLDTLIGGNDGAPFTVPGLQGLVTKKEFANPREVPDFVTTLEKEDLANPGMVVQLNLRNAGMESPSRVLLTRWPGADASGQPERLAQMEKWEVPLVDIASNPNAKDSSVVMYWPVLPLEPGPKAARVVGYSYGLGSSAARTGGKLSISVGGNLSKGGEFSVIAMMKDAAPKESMTLELPKGLELFDGNPTQLVPPPQGGRPVPVTWRVRSTAVGSFTLTVKTSGGLSQKIHVTIVDPQLNLL